MSKPPITLPPALAEWVRIQCGKSGAAAHEVIAVALEMGRVYTEQQFVPQMAAITAARETRQLRRARCAPRAGRRMGRRA